MNDNFQIFNYHKSDSQEQIPLKYDAFKSLSLKTKDHLRYPIRFESSRDERNMIKKLL